MLTRRTFLLSTSLAAQRTQRRPNLVLIFADDLGYGDLACYGHPTIRTPHLDRMAAEGMRFTQYYSANPLCSPSRASLLTGRLHIRSGINRVLFPWSAGGLPESEITIAQALKPLGYATMIVGKWHLGHLPKYLPTTRGFDHYFGIPYSNDMSLSQWPVAYNNGPARERYVNQPEIPLMEDTQVLESNPDQRQLTRRYTGRAVEFIRGSAKANRPFFLYFPHTFPHVPLYASAEFEGKSKRGLYGDAVEELDWSAGEIFRVLKETGQDNNTLVLFTSDNGPARMESSQREATGGSAGPFRDFKGTTWEGGVREPFLARWPGRIPAGRVSHAFAEAFDVFPTLLAAAGGALPKDREYDGADLSGVLFRNQPGREPLHFYYQADEIRGVRQGAWKLHLAVSHTFGVDGVSVIERPPLLYNLEHDPSERFNLAARHPERVGELQKLVEDHRSAVKAGTNQN
ncbi:MAG: sulfatase [Acidobacteria bacterium]|nr:sulfatase [Acidobacteriota bacterium]